MTSANSFCLGASDSVLPVVPMFHVNAWGIPYCAAIAGSFRLSHSHSVLFPSSSLPLRRLNSLPSKPHASLTCHVDAILRLVLPHPTSIKRKRMISEAFASGCKIVNPGAMLDGKSLYDAMVQENVNKTAGVPTIYGLLLQHISSTKSPAPPSLKTVLIGGSACPPSMIQAFDDLGVNAQHAVSQSKHLTYH